METSVTRLEISPKGSDMRFVDIQTRVAGVFSFVAPARPIKEAIPKAAKFLGLGERRVRALHAGEARTIGLADDEALFEAEVKISEHVLTKEMQRHADRLEYAALRYAAKCPDAYRDRIARWRDLARRVRSVFGREVA